MKVLSVILLLCLSFSANAQSLTNITQPEYYNIHNGSERIERVSVTKKKTIVYLRCDGASSTEVIVPQTTYIIDEKGNRYKVQKADGITLGMKESLGKKGKKTYTLTFPALPKGTTSFDMVQNDRKGGSYYLNIHQRGNTPCYSAAVDTVGLREAVDRAFPDEMFRADTVWMSGQFKGMKMLEREKCVIYVIVPVPSLCNNQYVDTVDINPDGTFKCAVPVAGPMWTELVVAGNDTHDVDMTIPAMLYPGDHLSLTVDNFSTAEPVYHWKSDRDIDYKFQALSDVFSTRFYKYRGQDVSLDSLKETVAFSEKVAGYLANKYKLSKAQTALLLTQANMSKICEAMRIVDMEAFEKRVEYRKKINVDIPTASQYDTIQSFIYSPKFKILSQLRADSKAFLVVPSLEELTREMLQLSFLGIDIRDDKVFAMSKEDLRNYKSEWEVHQLRKLRTKPLGTDRLLEQWLTIASTYTDISGHKPLNKEVTKLNMERVTLPVYDQWKRILLESK